MHASDALMSPEVAVTGGILAAGLIALSSKKVKDRNRPDLIPLMGVMGAFVFAAQMINFTIPGTGSSGHLIGGVLLAAILGPWAAFITLCSILIVQCLLFADGGLMALGCNILNMATASCLIAYPLVYKPIAGSSLKPWRIFTASILASVVGLEIGAFAVTVETEISGVTAIPFSTFLAFMMPIHVVIGIAEGIVTGVLLLFLAHYSPATLQTSTEKSTGSKLPKGIYWAVGILTFIFAAGFTVLASEYPDGLEWSIEKASGITEFAEDTPATAIMPDYDSNVSGIVGSIVVMVLLWGLTSLIFRKNNKTKAEV